jgi:AraC-like DNA-binding protein
MYQQVIRRKDMQKNIELARRLDELRTIFDVDRLTLEKQLTANRLYLALAAIALLLAVVFLYIFYTRRLRQKNRVLYDAIRQYEHLKSDVEAAASSVPEEQLGQEERLYRRLCDVMEQEQLFRDAELNREVLAARLGTNYNYVADAVRNHGGGVTVGEFINGYRLHMAASLLMEHPDLSVSEVEYQSGFNSRSTFWRLFKNAYGMSPTEYRRISKAKLKR